MDDIKRERLLDPLLPVFFQGGWCQLPHSQPLLTACFT
jgi:hypothetical protein